MLMASTALGSDGAIPVAIGHREVQICGERDSFSKVSCKVKKKNHCKVNSF